MEAVLSSFPLTIPLVVRKCLQRPPKILFGFFVAVPFALFLLHGPTRSSYKLKVNPGPGSLDDSGREIASPKQSGNGPDPTTTPQPEVVGCRMAELLLDDPALTKFFKDVKPLKCKNEPAWTTVGEEEDTFEDGAKYSNVQSRLIPDPEAIERARNKSLESQNSGALGINVMILSFDSLSRMTFMRKLPKTYQFLKEKLGAVVLEGYNIVGDGTPQAFIPILTSKTEEELPLTRKRYPKASFVDVYPMVWKDYKKAGYVTMYGEDLAPLGIFTWRLKGFKKQPTDHFRRTFYVYAHKHYKDHPPKCLWDEPRHRGFYRYNSEFHLRYPRDVRKWSLMHNTENSHDDVNAPQHLDEDFAAHLKLLNDSGVLDTTLLIVMADHGHRFAKFRNTQQGQLEERLPFMSFTAPASFRRDHADAWKNLIGNRQVLTTPFDMHATLKALLHWRAPKKLSGTLNRSLSLWDDIPSSRTCDDAKIEPHWCTCLNWEKVEVNDPAVTVVSTAFIQRINTETERYRSICAPLRVTEVESARRLVPHPNLLKYKTAKDPDGFVPDLKGTATVVVAQYQLRIRTQPGNGLYEATMSFDLKTKNVTVNLEAISHINKYGDNAHCIIDRDYFVAKYCVCRDKITDNTPGPV